MTTTPGLALAVVVVGLVASGCYLPKANVDRSFETFVLVSVSGCNADMVRGAVRNDSDVPVRVALTPRWLNVSSEVYHETQFEVARVEANSTVEWEAPADEEVDPPLLCQAEATLIESLE